ncbi:actin related protein 6 [Dictyostelium discoideum AX4]|uniref:Actin-related protein 6 n=1 Tax=Dictyostelium discoideum TaxID=44689 RepID=ARP6_DICDI|nr:actin related protein 6 [Dictyostelium discoideum AX4]Q54KZ7.1 RecName: Full=Actin-related protein 6 [Dictyostelium discoideum]EAL63930.1 actin related protein 6 [Dictyostelium discoideum AX4]|eukprot:XP_637435.1 actin related protein 6 [Dictyostelium discoideum AX4]
MTSNTGMLPLTPGLGPLAPSIYASNTNNKVLIIDNGGHTLKIATNNPSQPHIIVPNQVGKVKNEKHQIMGEELINYNDPSEVRSRNPMEKGYITNWGLEKEIWDYAFKRDDMKIKPQDYNLLLTEAPNSLDDLRKTMYEVVYEQYKFKSLYLTTSSTLGLVHIKQQLLQYQQQQHQPPLDASMISLLKSPCHLVVDCGYSSTHIIPHFQNTRLNYAIKRFNIGGKLLTNYLKEIVSFRYWDMMHETKLMNTIKEKTCFISKDFIFDIKRSQIDKLNSNLKIDYVLPNYNDPNNKTGYIKENLNNNNNNNDKNDKLNVNIEKDKDNNDIKSKEEGEEIKLNDEIKKDSTTTTNTTKEEDMEQVLSLVNERFTVPELLFNPSDIGMNQAGLAESIVQSINCTNSNLHIPLYSNIILLGGSTLFPGLKERLELELRKLAPEQYNINIFQPQDPILSPLYGGIRLAQQPDYLKYSISKQDYEEYGYNYCNKKFF